MSGEYLFGIFRRSSGKIPFLVLIFSLVLAFIGPQQTSRAEAHDEVIETITFKDVEGNEHEEYAFREPARGLPEHVMDMFCASVRMRLYWNVFRDEIKESARKGLYLRRMARLAKHVFDEVRDIDKPFNATMLSKVDVYMGVNLDSPEDSLLDKAIEGHIHEESGGFGGASGESSEAKASLGSHPSFKGINFKGIKEKITKKLTPSDKTSSTKQDSTGGSASEGDLGDEHDEQHEPAQTSPPSDLPSDSNEMMQDLERQGQGKAATRLRAFTKKLTLKNVALALYTRWRTMWWMMMSCLFAKYYLWDPALDEFIKLKRSLLMWPDLQLVKMHDLQCKPLIFFRRVMDICKILNPLMKIDFGQFNLEKLTRFKSDQS